ncbi:hypothetical protein BAOM_2425 [Peribacillus asahii]|uniref:Uncharacterized protein n=1 Tax=Peribacillus asahii TaxID=228899 RepID=A0A3Q9RN89_9BACI|nr:hypothetical protein BAOM_2425 [Peribacillus asahii]
MKGKEVGEKKIFSIFISVNRTTKIEANIELLSRLVEEGQCLKLFTETFSSFLHIKVQINRFVGEENKYV